MGKSYMQIKVSESIRVGTPAISFKLCTDILLDKPSILAEESMLFTDV